MIKNLLSITAMLLLATKVFAASISFTTMPATVEVGKTVDLAVIYTATTTSSFIISIFKTNADGTAADWSTWQAQKTISNLAPGTDLASAFTFTVPGSMLPSSELPAGIKYVWCLELTDGAAKSYSNNPATNSFIATPSSVVVNYIGFKTTPPSTVKQGDVVSFDVQFTCAQDSKVKVYLSTYTGGGVFVSGGDIVGSILDETATTTTKVVRSVQLTIPANAPLSSSLTGGNIYKWDIGIYSTAWAYYTSAKADVTITSGTTGLNKNIQKLLVTGSKGSISVNDAAGQRIQICNLSGASVKRSVAQSSNEVIDLPKGLYLVTVGSQTTKVYVK